MTYNHEKQYRATIIRGKAFGELDNLLPAYAKILDDICPCDEDTFKKEFNEKLRPYLLNPQEKTLDNHRTEIVGKLFGMFYKEHDNLIYISSRTLKLLEDSDQPAFFKDLCAKYQFPSGINKIQPKVQEHINNHLQIRQFAFVLKTLDILRTKNIFLTKKQIGYYLLNSYDVLSAKANIEEVINVIESDTVQGIKREIVNPEKASSYTYQHITEQLNLLLLANCIIYNNEFVILNEKELPFIQELAKNYNTLPVFNFYKYDLSVPEERKKADYDWNKYFSELSDLNKEFLITETTALNTQEVKTEPHDMYYRFDKIALGDEGEEFVYQLEKKRIENLFPRLVNKIKKLGKIKGIGYDIQSVIGNGKNPEFVKYIEVKSTKRVTAPTHEFRDSINLTRNEWTAAQQHNQYFYIYRVYFCQNETKIFIIHNPYNLNENNTIYTIPLNYRMDFSQNAGEFL